jgi:hypothetical protein
MTEIIGELLKKVWQLSLGLAIYITILFWIHLFDDNGTILKTIGSLMLAYLTLWFTGFYKISVKLKDL